MGSLNEMKERVRKLRLRVLEHNMHKDRTEAYYFKQYSYYLKPWLPSKGKVLDVGCQYGRFAVPLVMQGYDVTGTDIEDRYGSYIHKQIQGSGQFTFRKEDLWETIAHTEPQSFDIILCLEVVYRFEDQESVVEGLQRLLRPGGILAVSHRSFGHYLYQFAVRNDLDAMEDLLQSGSCYPNYPITSARINEMYYRIGQEDVELYPIGVFSGYKGFDPFGEWNDPGQLSDGEQEAMMRMETQSDYRELFLNNSRYILALSRKPA